jgi:ubiquinone biosynthesis protein COQ4
MQDLADKVVVINDLPPAVKRPVQWNRLRDNLGILHRGEEGVLDAAFSVGDAIGGQSDERQLRRLLQTDLGQQLVARHRDAPLGLAQCLSDFSALDAMPANSLGRAYSDFARRHGLDPLELIESQHRMSRDYDQLDPVRRWLCDRLTVMHDLWHVLTGYEAVPSGEAALMCFSLSQRINDRAIPIFSLMSVLSGKLSMRDAVVAFQRGRQAAYLPAQLFEDSLHLPLATVRKSYGISAPAAAHGASNVDKLFLISV